MQPQLEVFESLKRTSILIRLLCIAAIDPYEGLSPESSIKLRFFIGDR